MSDSQEECLPLPEPSAFHAPAGRQGGASPPVVAAWPTSQGGGPGKASPDIHRGHGVPDPVLVGCVVETFHRTEAGAAIIATDDIDSVM